MKIDGRHYRSVWVDEDGWSVRIIDQTKLPWSLDILRLTDVGAAAHAIRSMQVRGAPLIGAVAAYGLCLALREDSGDRGDGAGGRDARRDAPDRDQPALGDRPHADAAAQHAARGARRRGLCGGGGHRRRGCRAERGDRHARPAADRRGGARQGPGERAHPLQCGLARDGGLGHRAGADLQGARCRHPRACLGGRDAPAQPGRRAHRLGARPSRRAAHGDRRQCRRAPDAAWPASISSSSAPTA